MCKEMQLPIYSKNPNSDLFEIKHLWSIKKGWYDDGTNQFIVDFEAVTNISSFSKHYYRFPLYGQNATNKYFWLILSPFQNLRFSLMQYGVLKTVIMPFSHLFQLIKSFKM